MSTYQVIYADPPWSYRDKGQSGSMEQRGAATHYNTLTTTQIAGINVADVSADDAMCFMWITCPQLPVGVEVMRSWGFDFVTVAFTWVKTGRVEQSKRALRDLLRARGVDEATLRSAANDAAEGGLLWPAFRIGQGSHTRANAELCLLGRRGRGVKRISAGVRSEILEPAGAHSEKPQEARDRIVALLGDVPRLEMFARTKAPGWDAWGNEVKPDVRLYVPADDEFAWTGTERRVIRVRRRRA